MERGQKVGLRNHLVGLLLAAVYVGFLMGTAFNLGYSRDEGFYFQASRTYQKWYDELAVDPSRALRKDTIDHYFTVNHEHPVLMKSLFGFSDRLLNKRLHLLPPATALRLPGMLTAGLCVYLIYIWGAMLFGGGAGLFAAAAFALIPRVFYHAHLCCFDMPITAFMLLVTYLYWRSLSSWRFGLATGAALGFALCVKLNAFFLPFILAGHFGAVYLTWRLRGQEGRRPKAWAFLFGAILAPAIFMAHWPWLWHNTLSRLEGYMGFHSGHAFYNTAYFGEDIIAAPSPILLPTVMTLFTVPTTVVLLALFGMAIRARHHLPSPWATKAVPGWEPFGPGSSSGLDLLLIISFVFPIALISLPSVPIFGGIKHWMPALPYLALFAGVAIARLVALVAKGLPRLPKKAASAAVVSLLLLPPLQQTATSHPFGIASYVPLIGGARGAASLGMLRQYWGYTTAGVIPWLNREVTKDGRVYFHDTAGPSVRMFEEMGTLRDDIRMSDIAKSEAALLHHELHMVVDEALIWNEYRLYTPAHILTYQGVPIVSVYRRKPKK